MESLNTDTLIRLQVDQLEKEKRELNERLRIIAKRVDHTERAFRKEERPLLAKDYEQQLLDDRQTFAAVQKSRIEASRIAHQHDLETKKRMSRMLGDYEMRKEVIMSKRGNDFRKRKEAAEKKIADEKAKKIKAVLQQREEENRRREEEERIQRQQEEEAARLEAGTCKLR